MTLTYFNIQRFCVHDGPGIRTTVFLKGCPLDCLWCHNPESKSSVPQVLFDPEKCTSCGRCLGLCNARSRDAEGRIVYDRQACISCGKCPEKCFNSASEVCGKVGEIGDIMEVVRKDKTFYDRSGGGLTLSGGEPAMQAEASLALISAAAKEGIGSWMETCGFGSGEFYLSALDLGCSFLFDIKGTDPEKHKINTGVYPDLIRKNLDAILGRGGKVVLRLPIIPGKNDSPEDLAGLADFIARRKEGILYAEIMPYHNFGRDKNRLLGRELYDPIPEGKQFAHQWRESLSVSGAEIRISGE